MSWTRFFITNSKFTLVLTLFLVLYGIGGILQLRSEQFPSVDIGAANVTTVYPGASAEDVEAKITKSIEDEIRSVTGIKEVRSVSQPGLSSISIYVDIDNYNASEVIAELQRAVDRTTDLPIDLPSPPSFLEIKSDEFPVLELAVVGPNEGRLRNRVANLLKDELEDSRSVSGVQLVGFSDRQFNILLDQKKLDQLHVGINEVTSRLSLQNVTIPGGNIESGEQLKLIKIDGKLNSEQALKELVIRSNFSGEKIRLGDIATVIDAEEDPETSSLYNGKPATLLVVTKKEGADIITLAAETSKVIDGFREKYKGELDFVSYLNEGKKVERRIGILSSNGKSGLILVLILLLVFLPGRIGFMSSLSLPLTVFATVGFMMSYGLSLNTITILALVISLGMLVDNSVVVSENYVRLRKEGFGRKGAAMSSVRDLWLPITATALTTIAAFLPMMVTKGIIGQFIIGIPIVVTAALIISLAESFILLPMRLERIDKKRSGPQESNNLDWFDRLFLTRFTKLSRHFVKHRYWVALGFSGLLVGSIVLMGWGNKFVLFPADQTEIYLARLEMPRGTRIEATTKKMQELTAIIGERLKENAEHITMTAGSSQSDLGDPKAQRGENVGLGRIFVSDSARDNLGTNQALEELRKIKLDGVKDISFEALINGPPVGDPVTAVFRSNNEKSLNEAVEKIKTLLSDVPGLLNVKIDDVINEDEIKVEVDIIAASRLGLDVASIGDAIRTAMAGQDISDINLNNKEVDYFVRLQDIDRQTAEQLGQVKIMNSSGNLIQLSKVAKFLEKPGQPQIKRFDYKRAKTVTANVDDNVITALEANQKVAGIFASMEKDFRDVSLKFGGEGERIQESMTSLLQALIMSIIGIFAILVFLFKSYLRPFIIISTIPLGLVGVSLAFFLHNRPISFMAMVGIIGLGGIIVNSGIVLISFIESMRKSSSLPLSEILVQASALRLRAVAVTSITTVFGLVPTAYGIGGADEFIVPLTLAMAWGLTSGTVLALLWVPSAYAITEDFVKLTSEFRFTRMWSKAQTLPKVINEAAK